MTTREHPLTTRVPGDTVDNTEFAFALGDAASRVYVDAEAEGFGVPGEVAIALGQNAAGAETSLAVTLNESAPGTATRGFTMAYRMMIKRNFGGSIDLWAPRNSTNKIASTLASAARTLQARTGGSGVTPTTEVLVGSASPALTLMVPVNVCEAVEAGTTTSNGKRYLKVWAENGTVIHEVESTTSNLNTTNTVSANFGKSLAVAGTVIMGRIISENAYNKTLVPLAAPLDPPTGTSTHTPKHEINFAGYPTADSVTVASQVGPTMTVNISGLVVTLTDDPARTDPTTVTFNVTNAAGTTPEERTFLPFGGGTIIRRGGMLIMENGVII